MKNQKLRETFDVKLSVRNTVIWTVYHHVIEDIELSVREYDPDSLETHPKFWELTKLLKIAVRSRSTELLFQIIEDFDIRSILEISSDSMYITAINQLVNLLKKYPFKSETTETKAFESFLESERLCSLFNKENHKCLASLTEKHPEFYGCLESIQHDILHLLGDHPPLVKINGLAYHGPGATTDKRQHAVGQSTNFFKYSVLPYTVTMSAKPLVQDAITQDPRWLGALDDWYRRVKLGGDFYSPLDSKSFWDSVFKIEESSRLAFVPKTYKTDRSICIEPTGNVYLQLGVDRFIRARLKARWKIDLNQQETNQNLAYRASKLDDLSTLDLKGASDSVATKLCEMFLPPAWYNLLLDLRCKTTTYGGMEIPLEKISSMGNGYTFALESLIFSAILRYICKRYGTSRPYSVYGDDIIVDKDLAPKVIEFLEICGFRINTEKSFISGVFKESCGKDYYKGFDVRAVYFKKEIETIPDVFYMHNVLFQKKYAADKRIDEIHYKSTLKFLKNLICRQVDIKSYSGPAGENLDRHIFSSRRENLKREYRESSPLYGKWYHMSVVPVPCKLKPRYKNFFFIKLMNPLRERFETPFSRRAHSTGNAFDIVKRDWIVFTTQRVPVSPR